MKYKNAKYRFHADGSFDEKKEQKKQSVWFIPQRLEERR